MVTRRNYLISLVYVVLCAAVVSAQPPPPPDETDNGSQARAEVLASEAKALAAEANRMAQTRREERERIALEFLEKMSPGRTADLQLMKEVASQRYALFIRRLLRMRHRADAAGHHADTSGWHRMQLTIGLESEVTNLSVRYRESSDDGDQARIGTEMRTKLSLLFDLREQDKQAEVVRLESRLARLRRVIEQRAKNKEAIVERRAEVLLGERDTLEW